MKASAMVQTVQTSNPQINTTRSDDRTMRIRALNDLFRTSQIPVCDVLGKKILSQGIWNLGLAQAVAISDAVVAYTDFTEDNDPDREHSYGMFTFGDETIFWAIDYYDCAYENVSPDAANPKVTQRILTIMLADEDWRRPCHEHIQRTV